MEHFQTDLWGHASDDIFFRFLTPQFSGFGCAQLNCFWKVVLNCLQLLYYNWVVLYCLRRTYWVQLRREIETIFYVVETRSIFGQRYYTVMSQKDIKANRNRWVCLWAISILITKRLLSQFLFVFKVLERSFDNRKFLSWLVIVLKVA